MEQKIKPGDFVRLSQPPSATIAEKNMLNSPNGYLNSTATKIRPKSSLISYFATDLRNVHLIFSIATMR